MKNIKILIIIVVFNLISFGCGSNQSPSNSTIQSNATNQPSKANQSVQTTPPSTQDKAIVITAEQLSKEYKENEQSADAKYKGKTLEVSGKIENIDIRTFATVFLVAQPLHVGCLVQESETEEEKAGKLQKGQEVTVIGTGIDNPEAGMIAIDQCRVK